MPNERCSCDCSYFIGRFILCVFVAFSRIKQASQQKIFNKTSIYYHFGQTHADEVTMLVFDLT